MRWYEHGHVSYSMHANDNLRAEVKTVGSGATQTHVVFCLLGYQYLTEPRNFTSVGGEVKRSYSRFYPLPEYPEVSTLMKGATHDHARRTKVQ